MPVEEIGWVTYICKVGVRKGKPGGAGSPAALQGVQGALTHSLGGQALSSAGPSGAGAGERAGL